MTVVGSIAIMAAVIIGTLLGVTGMMPCGGGVPGGFTGAMCVRSEQVAALNKAFS